MHPLLSGVVISNILNLMRFQGCEIFHQEPVELIYRAAQATFGASSSRFLSPHTATNFECRVPLHQNLILLAFCSQVRQTP